MKDTTLEAADEILQSAPSAVTAPVSQFSLAKERLDKVKEYYDNKTLIPGEDYGLIPGTSSKKATLLKPGAQKLCALFDLSSEIKEINRVWTDDMIAYEVTVSLRNKQTGGMEAQGVGMCNSNETRYKNQNKFNIANTILKMAKKRALIDASLDALGISSLFTQDIEDLDLSEQPQRAQTQRAQPQGTQPQNNGGYYNEDPQKNGNGQRQQSQQQRPQNAASQSAPPPPPHIVKLRGAMKQVGMQYDQSTASAWLKAINVYLNETGDSPQITKLRDLTPELASDVATGITEGLVIVQLENTEAVPS